MASTALSALAITYVLTRFPWLSEALLHGLLASGWDLRSFKSPHSPISITSGWTVKFESAHAATYLINMRSKTGVSIIAATALFTSSTLAANATTISATGCVDPSSMSSCLQTVQDQLTTCLNEAGGDDYVILACEWEEWIQQMVCYQASCWNKVCCSQFSPHYISSIVIIFLSLPSTSQ
jgi:hypothetical protein